VVQQSEQNEFLETLWDFYAQHGRELPWRRPEPDDTFDPYKVMVSELMLQQTQVARVIPKYSEFLGRFPTTLALAQAELGDVLRVWQGLGYNRRAKFLYQAAKSVRDLSHFPDTLEELVRLPGVGANTAGAILAYAYNQPALFIETNVRTVYIHHFFADKADIPDRSIRALLEQTLDHENPRQFYWALMDYGSHLKATVGNLNKASRHYTRQPMFNGSRRQLRGAVIRMLGGGDKTTAELHLVISDERLESVLYDLVSEGLVRQSGRRYTL
jgi:A/G-specific adenine glycosylase